MTGLAYSFVALEWAPPTKSTRSAVARADDGQLYRNLEFGFTFRIPFGWVDRTSQMAVFQGKANADSGNPLGETKPVLGSREQGNVLLGIFERPPEVTSDSVNSAVVIACENAASYPGLKNAEDYVEPITEAATARGFKMAGEAYRIEVESRTLVRVDFMKTLRVKSEAAEITMRQSTLVWLSGKRVFSFTFIAATEEGLDEIMDGLHFLSGKVAPH